MRVQVGLEVLLAQEIHRLRGKRVGLVTNHTGVDFAMRSTVDLLHRHPQVELAALFGPEHGVRGSVPAGVHVATTRDAATGLPVYSLYGATREPTPEMLAGLDLLIFDIQDIGVRYYTYPYTLAYVLKAAQQQGLPVIVLDRPNPLGGLALEGNILDPAWASFVGGYAMPMRHGLTIGELGLLFNHTFGIGADLSVVPMVGWERGMYWDATGWPWIPQSPNTTGLEMALLYAGTCLFEGTNLSEGRGTTKPFEVVGAPWVDGAALAAELNRRELPGVVIRPLYFTPTYSKHAGQECQGVQVHVLDRGLPAVRVGLHMLEAIRELHPGEFAWREPASVGGRCFFDLLCGTDDVRRRMDAGEGVESIMAGWGAGLARFRMQRQPYLLY